ncbi:MAG: hypothetical protein KBC50_03090 [Candidatus Pacebacteria bacterium]|nr:hypothetical protein [Candidatus Paceibacterota bacterium]
MTDLEKASTRDIVNGLSALQKSLTKPEEIALLTEAFKRLGVYSQINASLVPPRADELTTHERHILQLENAVMYYGLLSHTLTVHDLLDWSGPTDPKKVTAGLNEKINEMKALSARRLELIVELYAFFCGTGGMFSVQALPDDVRIEVTANLKKRKLTLED